MKLLRQNFWNISLSI